MPTLPISQSTSDEHAERSSAYEKIIAPGGTHGALLDPTLPLLSQTWQRDRLALGVDGNFAPGTARARPDMMAINLLDADRPALTRLGAARITLAYDQCALPQAQAALIASVAQGGWPIARETESLALLTLAERIAASEIPVLLEGPTGTGKEVFARFVHRMSKRSQGPFIAVNCAAMPEAMLEGLLFGHRKGAFTGACAARSASVAGQCPRAGKCHPPRDPACGQRGEDQRRTYRLRQRRARA